jgi:Flagellar transcriptional activator (FlhD)
MKMVNNPIADVQEANLTYLTSAKKLAADDKTEAIKQFGLSEETVEILECLSLLQIVHLAEINVLLSNVTFDDHVIAQVLAGKKIRHRAAHSVDALGANNEFP